MKTSPKKGRPPGPKKAPELHQNTLRALAGRWTFGEDAPQPSKAQTANALAAFSTAIDPRLAELLLTIERTRGVLALRDLYAEEIATLSRVSGIAAAVGDAAFFTQVAKGMELAAKCNGNPVRLAVFKSWIEARKLNDPPRLADVRSGVKYRLGKIDPDSQPGTLMVIEGYLGEDILRDHLKSLGLKCVSRVSGKK